MKYPRNTYDFGAGVSRVVGMALFSVLVTACGSSGGGSSGGIGGVRDDVRDGTPIELPTATEETGSFSEGTNRDLVFPAGSDNDEALIRSADGTRYTYLLRQDEEDIGGTPGASAGLTFRFSGSPGGTCEATISPGESCTDSSGAMISFTNNGGTPRVCSSANGITQCTLFNVRRSTVNGVTTTTYTTVPSGFGGNVFINGVRVHPSPTGTLTEGSGTPGTPGRTLPVIVQEWVFETGDADVAGNVGSLEGIVDSANSGITVKGARSEVEWRDEDTGETETYNTDAYFFEADYSGFGIWLEAPETFFGNEDHPTRWDEWILPYGLATPSAALQALSGTAEYTGRAVGFYLRNGGIAAEDRYLVGGDVMLSADFDNGTISGNAMLSAYNRNFGAADGAVNVLLTGGTFDSASDARFEGNVDLTEDGTGVFSGLTGDVGIGTGSGFEGLFAGPDADEATGSARLITSDTDGGAPNGDGLLNFGFITEK